MGTHAYPIGTTKIEFTRYKNIVYALRTQLKKQYMSDDIRNENEDYNETNIISVIDEDGVEHTFEELDRIELDGDEYIALLPQYDKEEEILDSDGELIILKTSYEDDEFYLEPIEDDALFDKLGRMFEERLSDMFEFDDEE